jgi:hypothetical protein
MLVEEVGEAVLPLPPQPDKVAQNISVRIIDSDLFIVLPFLSSAVGASKTKKRPFHCYKEGRHL